ncbi:DUF6011 domain-containing protein [Streptomyces sp. CC224B]|uniref:DUF6011 domain-containing protein n=1 Tax=Streptomyces sp. CC224B TaxID=3044571 RepID=UPI0024A88587|nr:DUF6011 domain-containing protein [Streptomyces sp. CC224B]
MTIRPDDEQTALPVPVTRFRPVVTCTECKAKLTDSVSRRWALGPRCRAGIHGAPDPGRFAVEQDALPDADEP